MRIIYVLLMVLIAVTLAKIYVSFTEIAGGIACPPIAYIFPVMLHLKLVQPTGWKRKFDYLLIGIGLFAMIFITSFAIYDISTRKE